MCDAPPQVSVIVVLNNSLPALAECLASLEPAAGDVTMEPIFVDNASSDKSLETAQSRFPACRIIENKTNLGFAAACNRGAEVAKGEYLLFLNPDVRLDHSAIPALLEAARSDEKAGLVSGRMRDPDGSFQATCRRFPTLGNMLFSRGSVLSRWFSSGESSARYTLPDYAKTAEVPAVAATFVAIRRDLFDQARGFDERFFMYMEDTDLSLRLDQSGYRNLFVPAAGGVHSWGGGSDTGRIRRLWRHHHSVGKYFLKHFPNGFSVILLPILLAVHFVLRVIFSSRRGDAAV